MKRDYTVADMRRTLEVGWGQLGLCVADCWVEFNRLYFGGRLLPLPIFLTPVLPYGRCVGQTECCGVVTHIALAAPRQGRFLVADKDTLLHEMLHQFLHEAGENPKHEGMPWCREIMRLTKQITGKDIWAGAYTIRKVRDGQARRSVRINLPEPGTGRPSIGQRQIARWPDSLGIKLGTLMTGDARCCPNGSAPRIALDASESVETARGLSGPTK
jgi:hypothetical protein